jgi:hypothetical protein
MYHARVLRRSNRVSLGIVLGAALLGALLGTSADVEAQRASRRQYDRVIREAVSEFDASRWAEARALFEQAHELFPSARTLRGLGMCAFELREYDHAIRILSEALTDDRRPLSRRQSTQVQDLITRARAFIGRWRVTLEPPEAILTVDDAPAEPNEAGELVLGVGAHTLEATLDGYLVERRRIEVHGGEELEIALIMRPAPAAERLARASTPTEPIAFFVAAGGSLLFEVWSVGWLVDRLSEVDSCASPPDSFVCTNGDALLDQRNAAIGATISAGVVTLGLAAAGAILFLVMASPTAARDSPTEALRCAPGVLSVGCSGRF